MTTREDRRRLAAIEADLARRHADALLDPDPARRLAAVREFMAQRGVELARQQARTDHNGHPIDQED